MMNFLDSWLTSALQDMKPRKRDIVLWSLSAMFLCVIFVWLSVPRLTHAPDSACALISTFVGGDTTMGAIMGGCVIGLFLFGVPLMIAIAIRMSINAATRPPAQPSLFGSAHFATLAEIQMAHLIPRKEIAQRGESYLYLGAYHAPQQRHAPLIALSQRQQEAHVLMVAPTGRGKTAGIIIPNLLLEAGERSLLINDTKGSLSKSAQATLKNNRNVSCSPPHAHTPATTITPLPTCIQWTMPKT